MRSSTLAPLPKGEEESRMRAVSVQVGWLWNLSWLLSFPQLFHFSPVGYYFLTHFDNYFINQERLNKSLKIQLSALLEPTNLPYSDLGELYYR